jgi:hypothetical protein
LDPGSGLDPDPDPYQMNTDPKQWTISEAANHFVLKIDSPVRRTDIPIWTRRGIATPPDRAG